MNRSAWIVVVAAAIALVLLIGGGVVITMGLMWFRMSNAVMVHESHAVVDQSAQADDPRVHVSIMMFHGRRVASVAADEYGESFQFELTTAAMPELASKIGSFDVQANADGSTLAFRAEPDVLYEDVAMVLGAAIEAGHRHLEVRCNGQALSMVLPDGTHGRSSRPPAEPIVIHLEPLGTDQVSIFMHQGPSIPDGDFQRLHDILRGWRYDLQLNPHGMYADDVRIIIRPLAAVRWEHGFAAHAAIDEAGYANVLYAQPGVTLPAPPSVSPATSDEYDTPR